MFKELYDILPPYGQILLTLVIVGVGAYAAWQGLKKSRSGGDGGTPSLGGPVPLWAMMGPVHEVMQAIHGMAEEARNANAINRDALRMMERMDRGQDYLLQLMEAILRNQEMKGDYVPPSRGEGPPHRSKKGPIL